MQRAEGSLICHGGMLLLGAWQCSEGRALFLRLCQSKTLVGGMTGSYTADFLMPGGGATGGNGGGTIAATLWLKLSYEPYLNSGCHEIKSMAADGGRMRAGRSSGINYGFVETPTNLSSFHNPSSTWPSG